MRERKARQTKQGAKRIKRIKDITAASNYKELRSHFVPLSYGRELFVSQDLSQQQNQTGRSEWERRKTRLSNRFYHLVSLTALRGKMDTTLEAHTFQAAISAKSTYQCHAFVVDFYVEVIDCISQKCIHWEVLYLF